MLTKLITTIFISPDKGWVNLRSAEFSVSQILLSFLFPLIFLASVITFIGILLIEGESAELASRYFGFTFLKWISSITISAWAINSLVGGFKGKKDFQRILFLVIFSSAFFVIFKSLVHLFPFARIVLLGFSFVGLIYFYFGLVELSGISKERITGFLLISLLVFSLNVFVLEIFWGLIFNIPIQL
ncbi:MAG: hypothetical protein CVT98_10415 [Bacteroidetes bacterium HGW-Bacteroidetes-15]|nr:MAG: hypothetical protein CVT98_10415 [Bacteroidetes bacterium HGW-Bacteroidetes-15]